MIYLLDGNQEVIKIVRGSAVISVIQTQELPEDNSLLRDYLSVRLKNDERLFNAQYVAIKSYGGNRNAFDLYRIASELVPDNATEFMGIQVAPYELEGVVIEDLRPQNRPLNQTMNQVLEGSDWRLGYISDNLPNVTTNFYYTSVKDALKKIQELLNVEMLFKVEISGNKITDKWVEIYHQLGNRTMKRFNYGTNALSVVRESSHDELYTALIGRGKGEEVGETESGDATYGRKINFADVEWKKSAGNPVDKPKGQKYIELPNATAEYGIKLLDGRKVPRIGIVEFSETDDPEILIQETYQELLVRARPKVLFKASVINTGDMLIGDTVTIHRHDLDFHYQARVRKVVRDRRNNNKTQVEIGDVVHAPSTKRQGQINSALNNVASDLENARVDITEARQSADGKNTIFYGNVEPNRKKVGDTWFRDHPSLTGESQILVWNGEAWELIMDTSDTTMNAENILEAKGIAETARDNALNIATDLLEGTSFYNHTQNIGLASKNPDGTINSIINLGNDGTAYIGGENIVLDGNTIVDGTFTITDTMIAPNAEIDGAKIQDATIGSAKIASLDVSKITGNSGEFVRLALTGISTSMDIDSRGIYMVGGGAWRRSYLTSTGLTLWNGENNKAGAIGYFKSTYEESNWPEDVMASFAGSKHSIGIGANRTHNIAFGYNNDTSTDRVFQRALQIDGDSGVIRVYTPLTAANSTLRIALATTGEHRGSEVNTIGWYGGGSTKSHSLIFGASNVWMESQRSIMFYTLDGQFTMELRDVIHARRDIQMNGNQVIGSSDRRLKTNINDTYCDSLNEIKTWRFVNYEWIDKDYPLGQQFGLIAQETSLISIRDEESGLWSINQSKQTMVNSHAIQQLALKEENTNKVASQALQATESNESKIHKLQQELSKANRRIEELEGAM